MSDSLYLSPKADLVFKRIFADHPHLLMSFLNTVLPLPEDTLITKIEYLATEQVPDIPTLKNSIVDVKCTDQLGRTFIVEMQLEWSAGFTNRMILNMAKAFTRQLKRGGIYGTLCPVYGVAILDTIFADHLDEWFHHYQMTHTVYPNETIPSLHLIFIELPKMKPTTWMHKKLGVLWLRFLREINDGTNTVDPMLLEDPLIREAVDLARRAAYTLGELEWYDKYWDIISLEKTRLDESYSKGIEEGREEGREEGLVEGIEKGLAEGIEKGLTEGIEKGLAEGIEKGREEGAKQAKIEMAKAMLDLGISMEDVLNTTGLFLEDISTLDL